MPPGQGTDVAARHLVERIAREIGGTSSSRTAPAPVATSARNWLAKAPADGYTLLMGTNGTHAAAAFLYAAPGFDAETDFEPIALTGVLPLAIVTRPDNPSTSPRAGRRGPGQAERINVAVTTTTSRSAFELFKQRAEAPLYPGRLQGQRAGDHRPDRRPGGLHDRHRGLDQRADRRRQAQAAGDHLACRQ